jgi:hypothetical protein
MMSRSRAMTQFLTADMSTSQRLREYGDDPRSLARSVSKSKATLFNWTPFDYRNPKRNSFPEAV